MNKYQKELEAISLKDEKQVLKELEDQYKQAMNDIKEKINGLQERFNDAMDESIKQSIVYQLNYQNALKGQIGAILDNLKTNNFNTIQDYLQQSYEKGFIGALYDIQGQGIPLILPIDQEKMIKAILTDSKIKGDLYSSLGHNVDTLKSEIRREVTRGLANNYSYSQIAQLIDIRGDVARNLAYRIARTEAHRIHQAATYDAQVKAKEEGAEVVKQWSALIDKRTRNSHAELDGKIVEVEEEFEYNGKKALYPGGFGVASLDIHCRCRILQKAKWALGEEELDRLKERANKFGLDKTKDFEDFRKKYLNAIEEIEKENKSKINFIPSTTIQDARKYTNKFAQEVKLDKIKDIDSLNTLNETLEDLTTKYPTTQLSLIRQGRFKKYYAKANYKELDLGIDFINDLHNKIYKTPSERRSILLKKIEVWETKYLGNPKYKQSQVKKVIKEWKESLKYTRHNVLYKGLEIQSTIAHEYGHIIADQYIGQINVSRACKNYSSEVAKKLRRKIEKTFTDAKLNGDIYKISQYASQDKYEFFAESFSMYYMGQEELPNYIVEMVEEVIKYGTNNK